jgi:signal transduction histidine kinase
VKSDKLLKVEKDSFTSRSTMYRNLASLGISSLAFHHEIKQHVGRIGSGLSLVIDNWDDWDDDDKIEMLEDAKEDIISIKELNGYIREFASLFRGIRGAKRSKEIIDFKKSVENFKKGFKELLKISEIQIECIMGPGRFSNMHLNLASWESIMLNLIANSIKALDDVTRRKKFIKISFDKTEHDLKILIRDNGKGIPEDDYYRVFEPLWTTYKGVDDAGTGMGMPIVKEIIEVECGGEIFVKTSRAEKILPGEGGTTIQINIPLQYLQET